MAHGGLTSYRRAIVVRGYWLDGVYKQERKADVLARVRFFASKIINYGINVPIYAGLVPFYINRKAFYFTRIVNVETLRSDF